MAIEIENRVRDSLGVAARVAGAGKVTEAELEDE